MSMMLNCQQTLNDNHSHSLRCLQCNIRMRLILAWICCAATDRLELRVSIILICACLPVLTDISKSVLTNMALLLRLILIWGMEAFLSLSRACVLRNNPNFTKFFQKKVLYSTRFSSQNQLPSVELCGNCIMQA